MPDHATLLLAWRALPAETEWLEFKAARQTFGHEDLGRYVSALANEANLLGMDGAWMVFGVGNQHDPITGLRPVVGTADAVNEIKLRIFQGTAPAVSLADAVALQHPDGPAGTRVLLWRVPPAPRGTPVSWKGHFHGRNGESLGALAQHKFESIRAQSALQDWSGQLVSADWGLLDSAALLQARALYARRHASRGPTLALLAEWDDRQFLHHLRLAVDGRLTRAALLLLGTSESAHALGGPTPRLTWVLNDHLGVAGPHQHFALPLLLALDATVARIRIFEVSLLPPGQLAPLNMPNYDDWVLREALHNCIAHQDYSQGGRVRVTEAPDSLTFFNLGTFLPGSVARVLGGRQPEQRYRNACLANAMVELDLMETLNSGVPKMFRRQRERFFPLPDFEFEDEPASVSVRIHGKVLDLNYVRALMRQTSLSLEMAVLLDRVQKGLAIDAPSAKLLRAHGLVEGRLARLTVSGQVAGLTGREVEYVRQAGLDDGYFKALIHKLLATGAQPRRTIDALLLDKLPDTHTSLSSRRKHVRKLLQELREQGQIVNVGKATRGALWMLIGKK